MTLAIEDPVGVYQRHMVDELSECNTWTVSPYRGCDIRCTYCITGSQARSEAKVERAEVADLLRVELSRVPVDAVLSVGALSDAYPTVEAEVGLTRAVLLELGHQPRAVRVITKSTTVVRDIDALLACSEAHVTISAATADESAVAMYEPYAPSFAARLDAVIELRRAGIPTSISATPWIPGISDAAALIDQVRATVGEVWITIGPLNTRSEFVLGSRFGRKYRQAEVNDAFVEEYHRVGDQPGVRWLRPLPLDGHHAHHPALLPFDGGAAAVQVAPPRRRSSALPR